MQKLHTKKITKDAENAIKTYLILLLILAVGLGLVSLFFASIMWFGVNLVLASNFLRLWFVLFLITFAPFILNVIIFLPMSSVISGYYHIFKCKHCGTIDSVQRRLSSNEPIKCGVCERNQ